MDLPIPTDDYLARERVAIELAGQLINAWSAHYDECPAQFGAPCNCGLIMYFRSPRNIVAVNKGLGWEVAGMH